MPTTSSRPPDRGPGARGIDGGLIQARILREHGIEFGGGLGPAAPPIWRIGLMGANANVQTADHVLAALDAVLVDEPVLSAAT